MNEVIDMEKELNGCVLSCGIGAQPDVQLIAKPFAQIKANASCVLGGAPAILAGKALVKDAGEVAGINADAVVPYT